MEVRTHIQRTLNLFEGRNLFRDVASSDLVSISVLPAVPVSQPGDNERTWSMGGLGG